jgi:hypothetical protein
MKQIIVKISLLAVIIGSLCVPLVTYADDATIQFTPQVGIPGQNSDFQASQNTNVGTYYTDSTGTKRFKSDLLARYLQDFYTYGQGTVGIIAVIILMVGGIIWLTSAGDSGRVGQAKKMIAGAITGIIILFGSWIILNTINPDLVNLGGIDIKTTISSAPEGGTENSCCQYPDGTAKGNITAEQCTSTGGTHYTNSEASMLDGSSTKGYCISKIGASSTATKPDPDVASAYNSCCQYPDTRVQANIRQSVCVQGGGTYYANSQAMYSNEEKTKGACVTDIK